MAGNVLITGASGLLGRELVRVLHLRGFVITAHYHSHLPDDSPGNWIQGDLSTASGTRSFLRCQAKTLRRCSHFVHAYGPISSKTLSELESTDFLRDFQGNVVAFHAIANQLLQCGVLESAVAVGFSDAGKIRPYRLILTHAAAKNALLLLVLSLARENPRIRFNMVSPSTLVGARIVDPDHNPLGVAIAATAIADVLEAKQTGIHLRVTPEHPRGEAAHAL
ncbi:MAG: NAD-dependent epimerase/dehydratase family protein [Candidatus Aminicenantes bacterium]|nr:NAD-dependent epimerase/dehydratase family protein [Candidatus Aminicenantes bacterium]